MSPRAVVQEDEAAFEAELAALIDKAPKRRWKTLGVKRGQSGEKLLPSPDETRAMDEEDARLFERADTSALEKFSVGAARGTAAMARAPELGVKFATDYLGVNPETIQRHFPNLRAIAGQWDQWGRSLEQLATDVEDPRFAARDIWSEVLRGAGSFLPFAAAAPFGAGVAGLAGIGGQAGASIGVMLAGMAQAAVPAYEDVLAETSDPAKAWTAVFWSLPIGQQEALGLGGAIAKADRATGGSLRKALTRWALTSGEEGLQEWSTALQEAVSKGAITGKDLDLVKTLVQANQAGAVGALLGGAVGGLLEVGPALARKPARRAAAPKARGDGVPAQALPPEPVRAARRPEEQAELFLPGEPKKKPEAPTVAPEAAQPAAGDDVDAQAQALLAGSDVDLTPEIVERAVELQARPPEEITPGAAGPLPAGEAQAEPTPKAVQAAAGTAEAPGVSAEVPRGTERRAPPSEDVEAEQGLQLIARQIQRHVAGQIDPELLTQADTDPLTGLANRRGDAAQFERVRRVARRKGDRLVRMFGDLDNFKAVNTQFGDAGGDRAIQIVANAWKRAAEEGNGILPARKGGDEFVTTLRVSADADVDAIRDRMEEIAAQALADAGMGEALGKKIAASIGWVEAQADESLDDLTKRAAIEAKKRKLERGVSKTTASGERADAAEPSVAKSPEAPDGSPEAKRASTKAKRAVNVLRSSAAKIRQDATGELEQDRLENTPKRARQGNSARADARQQIELANVMERLAGQIEAGEAGPLAEVTTKSQVEELLRLVRLTEERRDSNGGKIPARELPEWGVFLRPSQVSGLLDKAAGKKGVAGLRHALSGVGVHTADPEKIKALRELAGIVDDYDAKQLLEELRGFERLRKLAGSREELRVAVDASRALRDKAPGLTEDQKRDQRIKEAESAVRFQKIPGFFPTPPALVERMVDAAEIEPGMRVLEPSAGKGDLAEAAKAAGGEVDVVERQNSLRAILDAKGFNPVGQDFTEFESGPVYDRILMNPPFEDGQDMEHVRRAHGMLAPGGRLVAIMSEGTFGGEGLVKKGFRAWLEDVGGTSEKVDAGAFKGVGVFRETGVATRLVVIDKARIAESKAKKDPDHFADASKKVERKPSSEMTSEDLEAERPEQRRARLLEDASEFVPFERVDLDVRAMRRQGWKYLGEVHSGQPTKKASQYIGDLWKKGDERRIWRVEYGRADAQSRPIDKAELERAGSSQLSASSSVAQWILKAAPDQAADAGKKAEPTYNASDEIPAYTGQHESDRVSKIQEISVDQIEPTESADEASVLRMMATMRSGEPLPAVVVEFSGETPDGRDIVSVIDGHTRLEAARRVGMRSVPVRVVVQAEDAQAVKAGGGMRIRTEPELAAARKRVAPYIGGVQAGIATRRADEAKKALEIEVEKWTPLTEAQDWETYAKVANPFLKAAYSGGMATEDTSVATDGRLAVKLDALEGAAAKRLFSTVNEAARYGRGNPLPKRATDQVWSSALGAMGKPAEIKAVVGPKEGSEYWTAYLVRDDGKLATVNSMALRALMRATKADGVLVGSSKDPVVVTKGKTPVAILMPITIDFGDSGQSAASAVIQEVLAQGAAGIRKAGAAKIEEARRVAERQGMSKQEPEPRAPDAEPTTELGPQVSIHEAREGAEEPPKTTSIKNAKVDAELEAMGLPPAQHGESVADVDRHAQAMERLRADPRVGERLIDDLEAAQRPPTGDEGALLALEVNRLILERDAAQEAFNADQSEANQVRVDKAIADYGRAAEVVTKAGTESSASLRIRKMMIARDYSLAAMERAIQVAKGGEPLTPAESAHVKELHDKLALATKALEEHQSAASVKQAELEAENALLRMKQDAKHPGRSKKRTVAIAESRARIDSLLNELAAKAGRARAGLDPETLGLAVKLAGEYIKIGYLEFTAWAEEVVAKIGEHIRPYLRPAWDEAKDAHARELATPIRESVEAGAELHELGPSIRKLAEFFVASGVETREALVDAVHAVLVEAVPSITRRQTMDAISGYGDFKKLSRDEVKRKLRDLKGQLQQVAKIEDLEARIPPKKTGVERRTPSDEERRLIKQVNDLKRRLGIKTTDPETQLRSALDQTKTRLRNQISDLQAQIDAKTPIVREKGPSPTDAEVASLKDRRDALREQFDEMFPRIRTLTDEQRADIAMRAVEKSIADIERRLATGDLAPRKGIPAPNTPALEAARARRDALREELKLLRAPAAGLQAYKTRKANEIARLKERTAAGEFTVKRRPPITLDTEGLRLKTEHEAARRSFEVAKERHRLKSRSRMRKALDAAKEVVNLPKAVMTAWDFSAVLRQGAFFSVGHPLVTLRSHIPRMLKAALSERSALETDVMVRNRPLFSFGEQSKLELTRHGDDLGPHEEAIRSRLSDYIPGLKASNRAFVTFLNMQRAYMFDSLVSALPGTPTIEQGKAIANAVNVATGRGNPGKFAGAVSALSVPLWSPRLMLSRFQLLLGQPLYKGDAATRARIAKEYGRFLVGMAGIYALAKMACLAMDDDKCPKIEADPRSSDFGKIRIGSVRVDPLAGLSQVTVLLSRLGSVETKRLSGELAPIRGEDVPYGADTGADVVGRFLRSKLAPTIGTGLDILDGENMIGEKVTPGSVATNLAVPLSMQDIKGAMQELGVPAGAALGILSIFGYGLQNYEPSFQGLMGSLRYEERQAKEAGRRMPDELYWVKKSGLYIETKHKKRREALAEKSGPEQEAAEREFDAERQAWIKKARQALIQAQEKR